MDEVFKKGDEWVMIRTRWLPKARCHRAYMSTSDGESVKVDLKGTSWLAVLEEIRQELLADGYTVL